MSEKEKKNAPQEEQPQANTTPETEQAAEVLSPRGDPKKE